MLKLTWGLAHVARDRAWFRRCLGGELGKPPVGGEDAAAADQLWAAAPTVEKAAAAGPLATEVAALSQPMTLQLLQWHGNWLARSPATFVPLQAQWIFALLVHLDRLVTADAVGTLRTLCRQCAQVRATLTSVDDPRLPSLNMTIAIVAEYYEQYDLADLRRVQEGRP